MNSKLQKKGIFDYVNVLLMIALCIVILYPFWNQVVLSFSDSSVSQGLGLQLLPEKWSLEAYEYIFGSGDVGRVYMNTIVRTAIGTVVIVANTILAAYPLSREDLPFRTILIPLFIIAMVVNAGMIPRYLLVRDLNLLNTMAALILPSALNVSYVVILRNFFLSISKEIEESAVMDGASPFQILIKIVLPLSKPIIVTIALWAAIYHWNEWFAATIYIQGKDLMVLQTMVRDLLISVDPTQMQISGTGASATELLLSNVRAATVMVSIGPIIAVYPFAQKYFVEGLQLGAVKG